MEACRLQGKPHHKVIASPSILTLLFSSSCLSPPAAQRLELGSLSSSASDPLRHHSDIQPYDLPNNEADDDLDTDDDNDNGDDG